MAPNEGRIQKISGIIERLAAQADEEIKVVLSWPQDGPSVVTSPRPSVAFVNRVARAIWYAQSEDEFPEEGSIKHSWAIAMAMAAIERCTDGEPS